MINRIQNKSFCLHNIWVCTVYIYYVYINTNTWKKKLFGHFLIVLARFNHVALMKTLKANMVTAYSFSTMLLYTERVMKHHLSLALRPRQLHLLQHLWALLHHQRLLIGERWDVTVMLESQKHRNCLSYSRGAAWTRMSNLNLNIKIWKTDQQHTDAKLSLEK